MQLRIGVHPNNLHLTLAAKWPAGFEGVEPVYVPYAEGRETGRRLAAGEIDVGGTGSTPPIRDQAAGLDVRYLAASAPRPENGAIVVAPGSALAGIRDLAGRRVGLIDGSFHTYLLARVLEAADLTVADVRRGGLP
ncbi:MAG: ABC transporter substrate-binding protein, partial [Alphaproteobacteria bacterium]|nr:ABC transporter substrate-binding protein [Alphaproteobacteria bacterium]